MIIRYAGDSDLRGLQKLCEAGDATFRGTARVYDAVDTFKQTKEYMERGLTLVAEHEGEIVGMVSRGPDPLSRVTHLVNLYVMPGVRAHGVGRALVEMAEQDSRLAKARVSLTVASDGSKEFYEKLGYHPVALMMEKELR